MIVATNNQVGFMVNTPVSACQSEKQLTMQTYVTLRILQMILFMFNVQHRYLLSSLKHDASSDFT